MKCKGLSFNRPLLTERITKTPRHTHIHSRRAYIIIEMLALNPFLTAERIIMSTPHHILLVEDDAKLGKEIKTLLEEKEFQVTWFTSGSEAQWIDVEKFSLAILDLMLPGAHGFDLLKTYRKTSEIPIIILTARQDSFDKLRGFELGGDDYMTKPFWPEELVVRVQARLRRPNLSNDEHNLYAGPITLNTETRQVTLNQSPLDLTRVEFDILHELVRRKNMAVTRRQLVERALPEETEGGERTLDVHISRIRKKLGESSDILATVWGIGYKFTDA